MIVIKGTGTLVTGGTLIPPTIDSDPYPNTNPNATIRSDMGVKGGLARRIGPGDVVVNLTWILRLGSSAQKSFRRPPSRGSRRLDSFDPKTDFREPENRGSGLPSPKEIAMRRQVVGALAVLLAAATATTCSQSGMPPAPGTFVTAEEIETVVKTPTGGADREVKIVDVGRYNVGVGVLRRAL
jgi:hypothetical protein